MLPFCTYDFVQYHFAHAILSATILFLSIPICPVTHLIRHWFSINSHLNCTPIHGAIAIHGLTVISVATFIPDATARNSALSLLVHWNSLQC